MEVVIPNSEESVQDNAPLQGAFRGPTSYQPLKIIWQILALQLVFHGVLAVGFYSLVRMGLFESSTAILHMLFAPTATLSLHLSRRVAAAFGVYLGSALLA